MATPDDHRLAAELAERTGTLLLRLRDRLVADGASADVVKRCGDLAAHQYLVDRLATERPEDAVLSEEATEDEQQDHARLTAPRVWIVDPLDGTREYGEGRSDWAVHVAIVEEQVPTAGAVAIPAEGIVLSTQHPPAAPSASAGTAPVRFAVSRTRPPAVTQQVADLLDAEAVPMGSAGVKAMAVVLGRADAYIHSGGQKQWDNCAPVAVAVAAGLWCSRLDGSPLRYNELNVELPDLLICRPELRDQLRAALDSLAERG
jgi:3'(2'), 5'-bisphosphate nucleotidase